jgi:ubiquinone/menaquinone biosynthesis C-methylase UbiE
MTTKKDRSSLLKGIYTERYELPLLRGIEEPRPWDIVEEVCKQANPATVMLDIGCGTALKLKDIASRVSRIYGLEPSERMRAKASDNISKWGITNIMLVPGYAESLPFNDGIFDMVTCMVAEHDAKEVWRVLKPGGHAILEKIGEGDKRNLKIEFGQDEQGWRGYLCEYAEGERTRRFESEFTSIFEEVSVRIGEWKTYYTLEGLILLCEEVLMVRGFDQKRDAEVLRTIQEKYMTEKGIETTQQRVLFRARK